MYLIDRRLNAKGKSLVNAARFLARARQDVRNSLDHHIKHHSMADIDDDKTVSEKNIIAVAPNRIHEPVFRFDMNAGHYNFILPGNKNHEDDQLAFKAPVILPTIAKMIAYKEGDKIGKPPKGGRGGAGDGSDSDTDDFMFVLSPEEYAHLFLEDLELPFQEERMLSENSFGWLRAGYNVNGSPANLALLKTLKNSYARRIGLHRPKTEDVEELEKELENPFLDEEEKKKLELQIQQAKTKLEVIPFIDPFDVRYTNFIPIPQPKFKAVMFCLMDVSGSMTENMKELAKRFYILLYRFLKVKYDRVEVVFIRHTHEAKIVDEDTFFLSPETGGTVVSTALDVALKEINANYDVREWNIYVAQASDGDNTASDNDKVQDILVNKFLSLVQYYAYIEVGRNHQNFPSGFVKRESDLWELYTKIAKENKHMAMKQVSERNQIYPVFRQLFAKKD